MEQVNWIDLELESPIEMGDFYNTLKKELSIWEDLEFDFKSKNINQDKFLSYLKSENG